MPVGLTVLLVIGFIAIMAMTGQVQCWDGGVGLPGPEIQGAKPCLNGSVFYLPALGALIVVGLLAEERRHRAAPYLLWAAAILAISITLRSLDFALCDRILIDGRKVGTHFAWHMLNGLALFLLLRASLEGGSRSRCARSGQSPRQRSRRRPKQAPNPWKRVELRQFTAIEMTLAKGLVPPRKPKSWPKGLHRRAKRRQRKTRPKEDEPVKTGPSQGALRRLRERSTFLG